MLIEHLCEKKIDSNIQWHEISVDTFTFIVDWQGYQKHYRLYEAVIFN